MNAGYYEEAQAWRDWLLRAVAGSPSRCRSCTASPASGGSTEWEVPWLPGYRELDAGAHRQRGAQPAPARRLRRGDGRAASGAARRPRPPRRAGWALQIAFLEHLEKVWREPDEGIWEVRSGREHFTYSKVMAWVAFDRAIKSAEDVRAATARSTRWRAAARRDPRRRLRARATIAGAATASCRLTAARSSTRACCCCRRSASCRRTIRACAARSRRSSAR